MRCSVALAFALVMLALRPLTEPATATDGLGSPGSMTVGHVQTRAVGGDETPPAEPQRTHPAKKPRIGKLQVQPLQIAFSGPCSNDSGFPQRAVVVANVPARMRALRRAIDRIVHARPHPALRQNSGQAPPFA